MLIAFVFLALQLGSARATSGVASAQECVRFSSARLGEGERFVFPVSSQLNFGLFPRTAESFGGWEIEMVDQADVDRRNLIPAVTPPLQTTPHLQFGPGYGLSARDSMFTRNLRFATSVADYKAASDEAYSRGRGDRSKEYHAVLDSLKLGELRIRILDFGTRPTTVDLNGLGSELLAWIAFEGEACLPK